MMRWAFAAAATLALAACGTITRGANEEVAIQVSPGDAKITTTLGDVCTGPCVVKAPRNKSFTVTAEAPGYESQVVAVGLKATGAGTAGVAGNILVGGIVGVGVDAATGAINDHVPNPVIITLQPSGSKLSPARPRAPAQPRPATKATPVS